jgi:hypothetical protein
MTEKPDENIRHPQSLSTRNVGAKKGRKQRKPNIKVP